MKWVGNCKCGVRKVATGPEAALWFVRKQFAWVHKSHGYKDEAE